MKVDILLTSKWTEIYVESDHILHCVHHVHVVYSFIAYIKFDTKTSPLWLTVRDYFSMHSCFVNC